MLLLLDFILVHPDRKNVVRIGIFNQVKPFCLRKRQRPLAGQHDVRRRTEHAARHTNGIDHPDDRGDRPGFACRAIHDRRIQLNVAGRVRRRSLARDIQAARFHFGDSEFDDIQCWRTIAQSRLAFCGQFAKVSLNSRIVAAGYRARAAMQCEGKILI